MWLFVNFHHVLVSVSDFDYIYIFLDEEAYVNEPFQSRKKLQLLIEKGANINEKFEIAKDGIHASILYLERHKIRFWISTNQENTLLIGNGTSVNKP